MYISPLSKPIACPKPSARLADRVAKFWEKVQRGQADQCWEWLAARSGGYGYVGVRDGVLQHRVVQAHRVVWELTHGPIPDGLSVLHRCDNRGCVNPSHLFTGTHRDNMRDMAEKSRSQHGERHAHAKLASDDVKAIRTQWLGGTSDRQLAAVFNVSRGCVGHIVHGRTWRHV